MACFFVRTGKDNIVEQYIKDIYNKGEKAGYKVNINAVWSFKKKELSFGDLYLIYNPLVPTMFTYLLYWAFKFNLRHRYKYKGEKAGYKVNINAVWSFKKKELSFGDLYLIYNPLVPTMFTYLLYWAFKFNLRHRYKYKGDIQRYTKNMGILTLEGMY
jgi:hypothetical protein